MHTSGAAAPGGMDRVLSRNGKAQEEGSCQEKGCPQEAALREAESCSEEEAEGRKAAPEVGPPRAKNPARGFLLAENESPATVRG